MPAKKGTRPPAAGRGRVQGVPNKTTRVVREVLQAAVESQQDRIQSVLDRAYKQDPQTWWDMLMTLLEYVTPKMQRAEIEAKVATISLGAPITSAAEASRIYGELMSGAPLDLDSIVIDIPSPALAIPSTHRENRETSNNVSSTSDTEPLRNNDERPSKTRPAL